MAVKTAREKTERDWHNCSGREPGKCRPKWQVGTP